MRLAAAGQLSPEQFNRTGQFVEESRLRFDTQDARVSAPGTRNPLIDLARFEDPFAADVVLFIAPRPRRDFEMNHCGVTFQFFRAIAAIFRIGSRAIRPAATSFA
jgi:hypothetical protein